MYCSWAVINALRASDSVVRVQSFNAEQAGQVGLVAHVAHSLGCQLARSCETGLRLVLVPKIPCQDGQYDRHPCD